MDPVERSKGAMLGHAAGNVLGIPWEGRPRRFLAGEPLVARREEALLPPDDDLAMALVLARHLAEHPDGIEPDGLLSEYVEWMRTSGRGIGGLTREVLALAARGEGEAARRVWEKRGGPGGMVLGNGSVMRCVPVGVRFRNDPRKAAAQACLDSSLTHWDERCRWASAAVVLVIAGHLAEAPDPVGEAAAVLEDLGARSEVVNILARDPVGSDYPESARLDGRDAGCCFVALRVARWVSQWAENFATSLERVLRAGGDTDTNGAVAGAVLGARFPGGIPSEWLEAVPRRDEVAALAEKLAALGQAPPA